MHNSIQMLRKHYWATVFVATILPAILTGIFEHLMSGGTSGWVPLWAGLISGVLTAAVLLFIQVPDVKMPESGKPDESGNERIFINKPPLELTKQVEGLTSIGSKYIVERYKGAWMEARGEIEEVFDRVDTVRVYTSRTEIGPWFTLVFDKNKWFDKLKMLDQGESMSVIGQIYHITEHAITLENCEIVDSDI